MAAEARWRGWRFGRGSLRGRLALWHGLALGAVLVVFALTVYGLVARGLTAEVDRELAERAQQVARVSARVSRLAPTQRGRAPLANPFASEDTYVQVGNINAQVVRRSQNLGDAVLPLDRGMAGALTPGEGVYAKAELRGAPVRLYTVLLPIRGRPPAVVQVARGTASMERILGRLRRLLAVGLLGALGLSGLVVWLAAGRAVAPLGQLIETAETVGASGDLSRRVDVSGSDGEVGELAATFNTMLQRLERTDAGLRAARVRTEEALEAQRRFVADAAHELRTPLTTIRGNAELLRDYAEVTPQDHAAALAQIQRESERMSRLVNDLLTLARADAGQPLSREPVALGPLLSEVAAQARVLTQGRHLSLAVAAEATVLGDADPLRQLLLILLDNALRHTLEDGSVNLRLETQEGKALISVADSGQGIAPEDMPHIFERFYQADRARSSSGVGLGLAIAQWIVREHGGEIEVSSNPGQGSVFLVRLPLATPASSPETLPAS